jgi:hypothetical protein
VSDFLDQPDRAGETDNGPKAGQDRGTGLQTCVPVHRPGGLCHSQDDHRCSWFKLVECGFDLFNLSLQVLHLPPQFGNHIFWHIGSQSQRFLLVLLFL